MTTSQNNDCKAPRWMKVSDQIERMYPHEKL